MLAGENRLRDSDAFRRTVRSGRRAGGAVAVVHVLMCEGATSPPRVGLVVSKAVGNSVTRNRTKRRLRHLVREVLSQLPPGSEVVIRALPPAARADGAELAAELGRCLDRACRPAAGARTGVAT